MRRGCGSPATLLVADDAETHAGGFSAPQARLAPLSRQTAIVHLLETAGAAHESPRTTKLYDRTADEVTVEDIEKIGI